MIHQYEIDGLPLETGDLICTTDGDATPISGQFWRLIGKLVPGPVDHIIVYVGPAGKCVESGPLGVITFAVEGHSWIAPKMQRQRGLLLDTLYGVAYPFAERNWPKEQIFRIRESVAEYCLTQAAARKPYNLHYLNPATEAAFYCSQLAYKAYLPHGIDLNTGMGVPNIPGTTRIIYPQEIWSGSVHRRPPDIPDEP